MDNNDEHKTRYDKPPRVEKTITQTFSAVDVDDLPAAPASAPRCQDIADLIEALRYQLHHVEAQVVSLGRELVAVAQGGTSEPERALHLVTSSISATRAALRAIDRLEVAPRRARSPIPSR